MAHGAGKYDDHCTQVRENCLADAVAIIVINGISGSGFSVQTNNPLLLSIMADCLEDAAKRMRSDARELLTNKE